MAIPSRRATQVGVGIQQSKFVNGGFNIKKLKKTKKDQLIVKI
jgi:hypothetical protein